MIHYVVIVTQYLNKSPGQRTLPLSANEERGSPRRKIFDTTISKSTKITAQRNNFPPFQFPRPLRNSIRLETPSCYYLKIISKLTTNNQQQDLRMNRRGSIDSSIDPELTTVRALYVYESCQLAREVCRFAKENARRGY